MRILIQNLIFFERVESFLLKSVKKCEILSFFSDNKSAEWCKVGINKALVLKPNTQNGVNCSEFRQWNMKKEYLS